MGGDDRSGAWARMGAVGSAALASMCCILPLGLGVLGISSSVVAAFFVPLRPFFLGLAASLLVLGIYFAFRRPAEGAACASDSRTLSKLSRPTLWISTVLVIGLAMVPNISGIATGDGGSGDLQTDLQVMTNTKVVSLAISGMTCESCTAGVRTALLDVPGVVDAAVSFEHKSAQIRVRLERGPAESALLAAVEASGYSAQIDPP